MDGRKKWGKIPCGLFASVRDTLLIISRTWDFETSSFVTLNFLYYILLIFLLFKEI